MTFPPLVGVCRYNGCQPVESPEGFLVANYHKGSFRQDREYLSFVSYLLTSLFPNPMLRQEARQLGVEAIIGGLAGCCRRVGHSSACSR